MLKANVVFSGLLLSLTFNALAAGDVAKGKVLYGSCVACHGEKGEGGKVPGALPLTGKTNEYILKQLKDFKSGARKGTQMPAMITALLPNDQAAEDVAAYIAATFGSSKAENTPAKKTAVVATKKK